MKKKRKKNAFYLHFVEQEYVLGCSALLLFVIDKERFEEHAPFSPEQAILFIILDSELTRCYNGLSKYKQSSLLVHRLVVFEEHQCTYFNKNADEHTFIFSFHI